MDLCCDGARAVEYGGFLEAYSRSFGSWHCPGRGASGYFLRRVSKMNSALVPHGVTVQPLS